MLKTITDSSTVQKDVIYVDHRRMADTLYEKDAIILKNTHFQVFHRPAKQLVHGDYSVAMNRRRVDHDTSI